MTEQFIGQYRITGELGRGGMGVVYKARDESLDRDVAIKVLSDQLSDDDSIVERFTREAKSMAALNDSHIIQVYYIGEHKNSPFFCMEFVEGESLSERLKRSGKLGVTEARRILMEAAQGLETAHEHGVIHRDIKPGNIMLARNGRVKLADFGIAMVQDFSKRLTNTGEFVGTPGYLSPEVCIGQPVDHRSDIFALGIVLFEMLTGNIPFTESSPLGMMLEVVKADIPDIRSINSEIDEQTYAILSKMIAKDPAHRYQNCGELIKDLQGTQAVVPTEQQDQSTAFASAATMALAELEEIPELELSSTDNPAPPRQADDLIATPAKKTGKVLPWAVAAMLVLTAGGATTYLFRDKLFGDVQATVDNSSTRSSQSDFQDDDSLSLFDSIAADNSSSRADSDNRASAGNDQSAIDDAQLDAQLRVWTADNQDALGTADDQSQSDVTDNTPVVELAMNDSTGDSNSLPTDQTSNSSIVYTDNADARADASKSVRLDNTASQSTEPVQLARVDREPVHDDPPPRREPREPKVVVMAIGDRAIASPIEQLIEDELTASGIRMLDESFISGIGRVAHDGGVDMSGLADLLMQHDGDVLVLAEVDYLGETPLQYYGQTSILYSVNVKVRNILLPEKRPLGRGWNRKVDFTAINANEKAREAVDPILGQLVVSLSDYRD